MGNARGVRLPASMIRRHNLAHGVMLEERQNEIVLRPKKALGKLSWEETAREMAVANEEWRDWEGTLADGLDSCPWDYPLPPEARAWARESGVRRRKIRRAAAE